MYDVTFIKKFESTVRKHWNDSALTDYKHPTATYGQLAAQIEADQLLWKSAGISKGSKIALNAKSCAGWIKTFMGIMLGFGILANGIERIVAFSALRRIQHTVRDLKESATAHNIDDFQTED